MLKNAIASLFLLSFVSVAAAKNLKSTGEYVPSQLIVKYKDTVSKTAVRPFNANVKKVFRASGAELMEFSSFIDVNKMMEALKADENVAYVEFNQIYRLSVVPDDSSYEKLYGMEKISAPLAWETTKGSKAVVVGVIDTGIDHQHPDLASNVWINQGETGLDANGADKQTNGVDDDGNGYVDDFRGWDFINGDNDPMDGNGHGSHVAGTIGAVGNNDEGVVGVNWEVSLVGLKIFSDGGSTTAEAIVEAIEYSTLIGIDVTNNSWGGGRASETIRAAISEANDNGIIFVAAAGNSSANNDTGSFYPANYELENIISVAATGSRDELARFSNYGAQKVHVAAPGVGIYSTEPGGGYQNLSGTSMAAPHVAGLVALVKSQFPDISMSALKTRVVYTGDDINALSSKLISGKRINAAASLEMDSIPPAAISSLSQVRSLLDSSIIQIAKTGDDGNEGEAVKYEIKISDSPIDDRNWNEAAFAQTKKLDSDSADSLKFEVLNLKRNSRSYVAARAMDSTSNYSTVSENIVVSPVKTKVFYENTADSLADFTTEGKWGLETIGENTVLSDSPEGTYSDDQDDSLTMKSLDVESAEGFLSFKTKYSLETRFDKVFVEVATDGSDSWEELVVLNGNKYWHSVNIDLSNVFKNAKTYQIRFRLKSDRSVSQDGILIDDIAILTLDEEG